MFDKAYILKEEKQAIRIKKDIHYRQEERSKRLNNVYDAMTNQITSKVNSSNKKLAQKRLSRN